jgi:hypothetical protein
MPNFVKKDERRFEVHLTPAEYEAIKAEAELTGQSIKDTINTLVLAVDTDDAQFARKIDKVVVDTAISNAADAHIKAIKATYGKPIPKNKILMLGLAKTQQARQLNSVN